MHFGNFHFRVKIKKTRLFFHVALNVRENIERQMTTKSRVVDLPTAVNRRFVLLFYLRQITLYLQRIYVRRGSL